MAGPRQSVGSKPRVSGVAGGSSLGQTLVEIVGPKFGAPLASPTNIGYVTYTSDNVDPTSGIAALLGVGAFGYGFDGALADRLRTASAANLAALSALGAQLVAPPGNWSTPHTPASATRATCAKAAGAAGVVHVCTSITARLIIPPTVIQPLIQANLRDGATGAGTILWSATFGVGVAVVDALMQDVQLSGLNIIGTAATAMTLEFTAAGAAGTVESVAMTGYDAS